MSEAATAGLTSIIVVAADSGPLLRECIDAALASDAGVEVVLVDNASGDGEVEAVAAAHAADTRLRTVRNATNLGFGPACNRGAAIACGDRLMFLNPDCLLQPATVAALRDVLDRDAGIGLLGVMVCDPQGKPARGIRRRDPTLRRALASATGVACLELRWPLLAGVEMPAAVVATSALESVEAVSGACMTLPRRVFEQVGGFDERYFLHVEDLDLCRRVRNAGHRVVIAHALRVLHAQGSSSRHRPLFVAWHKHRGMWRYFRTFDPAARNPALGAVVWLGIWTHFVLAAPVLLIRTAAAD